MPEIEHTSESQYIESIEMKAKVKCILQRNKNVFQLGYNVNYMLILLIIIGIIHIHSSTLADAYVNAAISRPVHYFDLGSEYSNRSRIANGQNRSAKFLFDTIFGINTPTFDEVDEDDLDDEDEEVVAKPCQCDKKGCGQANQEVRIVGGKPTGINQYPWIARLVYDGNFHCGASLVSKDYVLTAAHCVRRLKRSKIRIILGDHDQTTIKDAEAKMRAVSAIIRHRSFDSNTYNHDIALLKLRKPIQFTKNIMPVCLPADNADPSGKTGIAVGWGRVSEGGALPSVVQHVEVPILSLSQCRNMKYRSSRITPNMVCAGKGKQDSCQGDSGGPLLVYDNGKFEIVGIVSWGVGCARPGYPGVYTRVARYMPWVRANTEGCLCSS